MGYERLRDKNLGFPRQSRIKELAMLFHRGKLDERDSSEDCLVAKIFCGLIFNDSLPANARNNYALARAFLKYFLDPELVETLDFENAELCLKPTYQWFGSTTKDAARKKPDLVLWFPTQVAMALEAKYTE